MLRSTDDQGLSSMSKAVLALLFVMIVTTVSYRKGVKQFVVSTAGSLTQDTSATKEAKTLTCKALPGIREYNQYTDLPGADLPEWFQLKLRLNASQSGIFPFPKVFESSVNGPLTRLSLRSDFSLHIRSDLSDFGLTGSIFERYCQSSRVSTHLADTSITTIDVSKIIITFSPEHLLASSDAMRETLSHRSPQSKKNAIPIDAEMYKLAISADGTVHIVVHAKPISSTDTSASTSTTAFAHRGAANALATLDQLLHQTVPLRLPLKVVDWPDNPWRGLLLDVSRHYFPLSLLKRCIAAMSASKFDTLHLHLTDSQSFPLLLEDTDQLKLSELALQGAFSREKMYTLQNMQELVAYGISYGIDIIPEIDMPAHTLAWGKAFPEIIVNCSNIASRQETPHNIYPLDPSNPKTYEIIQEVLKQVSQVFPTKYLHIGGDEVEQRCWEESVPLKTWCAENNISIGGITKFFEQRVVDIAYDLNKVPIVWQGILDSHSMPPVPFVKNSTSSSGHNTTQEAGCRQLSNDTSITNTATTNTKSISTTTVPTTTTTNTTSITATSTLSPKLAEPAVVQPWKCWGGLAMRTATQALNSGHPVVMSACWYLDYNQEWSSYLAVDLTASARASAAEGVNHNRGHSRGGNRNHGHGNGNGISSGRSNRGNNRVHRRLRSESAQHNNNTTAVKTDTTITTTNTTTTVDLHALLNHAQRMYLSLTEIEEEEVEPVNTEDTRSSESPTTSGPALHSNYFIPGGEASMWTERVDCANLECRLWPRAGAVAARLWGLGENFESVSYYNTAGRQGHSSAVREPGLGGKGRSRSGHNRHRIQPSTQTMALDLPQTVELYTSYIQYRYYLSGVLGMSPSPFTFHYPLRCHDGSSVGNNNNNSGYSSGTSSSSSSGSSSSSSSSSGTTDIGNSVNTLYPTPTTPQQVAMCHANNKRKGPNMIYSEEISHPLMALSRVYAHLHNGVEISSNSNNNNHIQEGTFRMTAQCLGIPEAVQRPLQTTHVNVVQLNVADGSTGLRGQDMLKWLQQQANAGVLLVGFCELNGWQDLESNTELFKNKMKIVYKAANAGFAYSHVMVNTQPYNLGIVSARPFVVLAEYGPPVFQRGVLHVFYPTLQLHVFIVHLHAHSSAMRTQETKSLLEILRPLLQINSKFVVMGDFNTLSRHDHRQHEETGLAVMLRRTDHPTLNRLRKKFLDEESGTNIDYRPMDVLLEAGLRDACAEFCSQETHKMQQNGRKLSDTSTTPPSVATWSMGSTDAFSRCMQKHCSATEPTKYNPEWPLVNESHPHIRLDFILLSPGILQSTISTINNTFNNATTSAASDNFHSSGNSVVGSSMNVQNVLVAGVDTSNITDVISDHYPVYASWIDRTIGLVDLY